MEAMEKSSMAVNIARGLTHRAEAMEFNMGNGEGFRSRDRVHGVARRG